MKVHLNVQPNNKYSNKNQYKKMIINKFMLLVESKN